MNLGKLKQQKKYILTEREINYLKILNYALITSTLKDKTISGFLYYVCNQRFGFNEDVNLMFEIDLDNSNELKVREIPTEVIERQLKQPEE